MKLISCDLDIRLTGILVFENFRNYWEHYGPKSAKSLHRKAIRAIERVGLERQKGNQLALRLRYECVRQEEGEPKRSNRVG
jgi:hypothetical protein